MVNPNVEMKSTQDATSSDQVARLGQMQSGSAATPISPTGSPFTVQNITQQHMEVIVSGGTVTTIEIARGGTFVVVGLLGGQFHLGPLDQLKITYVLAPTITAWTF